MSFTGVTLALVYPVNPELTDRSVLSLSTTITSGAGVSDWVIKFGRSGINWCTIKIIVFSIIVLKNNPHRIKLCKTKSRYFSWWSKGWETCCQKSKRRINAV